MYSDDDFSDPEDFVALSSGNEDEKDYDSDKDPVWDPKMSTKVGSKSMYLGRHSITCRRL